MRVFKMIYLIITVIAISAFLFGCQKDAVEAGKQTDITLETQSKAKEGTFIMDILIEGMSVEEANAAITPLKEQFEKLKKSRVIFEYEDKSFEYHLSDYALEANFDETIYSAVNDKENDGDRIFIPKISYNKEKLAESLAEINKSIEILPQNPKVVSSNGTVQIEEGSSGNILNEEKAIERFEMELINTSDEKYGFNTDILTVNLEMSPVALPNKEISADDFKDVLGTYTTKSATASGGRYDNLLVASGRINGLILYPGDVFSTNKAILQRTVKNGYKNAPVIENGEFVDGMGGGVCQISSTLYNAVLLAELEVVERLNHSLPVAYVPIGRDATIVEDIVDFKFKNNTGSPIYIEYVLKGRDLIATIYGKETRSDNRKIKFESAAQYISPPPEIVTNDPALPLGERVVDSPAKTGSNVQLYKLVYVNDTLVEKIKINDSKYRTKAAKVRVGTGDAAPVTEGLYVPQSDDAYEQTGHDEPINTSEVGIEEYPITTVSDTLIDNPQMDTDSLITEPLTERDNQIENGTVPIQNE